MIKFLTPAQIKQADSQTLQQEGISELELIQRAASAAWKAIKSHFQAQLLPNLVIACGPGNNGADGLAIAQLAFQEGAEVEVVIPTAVGEANTSSGFIAALEALSAEIKIWRPSNNEEFPALQPNALYLDCLFGVGLSRPLEGIYASWIEYLNQIEATVWAIDIASGLPSDFHRGNWPIQRVERTLTFQTPKLAFIMPENEPYVGVLQILSIGLHTEELQADIQLLEETDIAYIVKPRRRHDHKGRMGRALLVGGSIGKIGAIRMAAEGGLRSGVGLLTVYTPQAGLVPIQTALPEAMVIPDTDKKMITEVPPLENITGLGIGPGMGTNAATVLAFTNLISKLVLPVVLDADALNIIARNPSLWKKIPPNSILTPHPREFERLAGKSKTDYEVLGKLVAMATEYKIFVVLKGANTCIATPEGKVYVNNTGNPGMATGGSGDVLTGILTGLLARGYSPENTCKLGVWIHGLAGDFAAAELSQQAMIAGDLLKFLPMAWKHLNAIANNN